MIAGGWLRRARGRWLVVRVAGLELGEASDEPCVVLEAEEARWPSLRVAFHPVGREAHAWVFVGEHAKALQLEGSAERLASLEWLGAEVADEPPLGATAPLSMRTSARLQSLGVRALQQIELTDEARWPLAATGADPQLRFRALVPHERVTLCAEIAIEGEPEAQPVAYWASAGATYDARHAAPLVRDPEGRWRVTLPALGEDARFRIDPMDRPGRFRVDALETHTEPVPSDRVRRWLRLVADRLHGLRPWRQLADLAPAHDLLTLGPLAGRAAGHRYLATGHDPQLRLRGRVEPGWYVLELMLELPAARARARVYLDTGAGESEDVAWSLPVRSGQMAKRVLRVDAPSHLRLDPIASPGELEVRHFRWVRVGERFAVERMRRKLGAARARPARDGAQEAASTRPIDALWREYCLLFEAHGEGAISYAAWIDQVEQPSIPTPDEQAIEIAGWAHRPTISILTPTYATPPALLRECFASVRAQTYPHWEWCVADDASPGPEVRALLAELSALDPRVKLVLREENGHIAAATNSALALATGEHVALLDHDDVLTPHALFSIVRALQERPSASIVYSDEDKLDERGERCEPFFKPDFSPDLLRSQNYVSHLGVYRRALVVEVGGLRAGFEGSQDYDLLLRCAARIEDVADIVHVPHVLYHWRKGHGSTAGDAHAKPYAIEAARRALEERADAEGSGARVEVIAPGLYRHRWPLPGSPPLTSLIIPTRDSFEVLRTCIESIVERTTYPACEILVVDNQSTCSETLAYLDTLERRSTRAGWSIRVLRYDHAFNYAAINNHAAREARGDVLALVNNDVEVITPDWLSELVAHALRPDVGCVGAKLYYPDDTVQHAGVVLGIGGVAGHSHKYSARDADGYFSRLRIVHDVSAVTGAALVVRRDVYERIGGLDDVHLSVAFNDVDFCLKVRELGLRNVWTPFAELYHHESKSRGADTTPEKQARFRYEAEWMRARWGSLLDRDPYYNRNLTLKREDYSIGLRDDE